MAVDPKKLISLTVFFVLQQFTLINSDIGKLQDGWLYPGLEATGIHLTYSANPDWSDLWKMMNDNGFYTLGKLCVRGVFVLYQEPLFAVSKPSAVEVLPGNLRCTLISENTKSIQLVGSMSHMYGPSITFFEKPHFGSTGLSTLNNVGSSFFDKLESTRSAILVGREPWTLLLSNGRKVCVQPEFDPNEQSPVCLIKDFATVLGTTSNDDDENENDNNDDETNGENDSKNNATSIRRASQGCTDVKDGESIYRLQDCMYWRQPETSRNDSIQYEVNVDDTLGGRSDTTAVCGGNADSDKALFKLYKAVITKTFDTDLLVGLSAVGRHSWKLELLDWMFTIVTNVIPDNVIPTSFLNKVRELFVQKLVTIWGDPKETSTTLAEKSYKTLLDLTEYCSNTIDLDGDVDAGNATSLSKEFTTMWQKIAKIDDMKTLIIRDFERQPKLDIITEMVYIVGHMACFVCHAELMYRSHYWALYYHIFWSLYLQPVAEQWAKPTMGLNLFFGGTDIMKEYQKLAMFASVTQRYAKDLEVLTRPVLLNGTIVTGLSSRSDDISEADRLQQTSEPEVMQPSFE